MLRSLAHGRYLVLVALISALVFVPLASAHDSRQHHVRSVARRDGITGLFPSFGSSASDTSSTTAESSKTSASTSPASSTTTQTSSASDTSKSTDANNSGTSTSSNTATSSPTDSSKSGSNTSGSTAPPTGSSTNSNTLTSTPSPSGSSTPNTVLSTSFSTAADGSTSIVIITETNPAASPSNTNSSQNGGGGSSSGISTGGIIGLSVAGGVLLLSVVAFAIFKFSRKRYLDEYDDGDAIKWPELNTHGDSPHALPTHRTGGAGFDTSSEVNLTRPDSRAGSIAPSAAASAVDLYPSQHDPYAVPPLPHLNPNVGGQPYRDDPGAGYYDPYSGPVPHTLEGEAIPMTQIPGRARSPMPGAPGMGMPMDAGRRSPGPAVGLAPPMAGARAVSPGPGAPYGGYA